MEAEDEMEQVILKRTGREALTFTGRLVGTSTGTRLCWPGELAVTYELKVWLTDTDKYVMDYVMFISSPKKEALRYHLETFSSLPKLAEWVFENGASLPQLLEEAAETV